MGYPTAKELEVALPNGFCMPGGCRMEPLLISGENSSTIGGFQPRASSAMFRSPLVFAVSQLPLPRCRRPSLLQLLFLTAL